MNSIKSNKRATQKKSIIPTERKWKFSDVSPTAPNNHGKKKLHNQNAPIRPMVKYRRSPAYNVGKSRKKGKIKHESSVHMQHLSVTSINKDLRTLYSVKILDYIRLI